MKVYTDFYEMLMDIKNDINNDITVWIERDYSDENIDDFYKEEFVEGQYYVHELLDLERIAMEIAKLQLEEPNIIVVMQYHWEYIDDEPVPFKAINVFRTND